MRARFPEDGIRRRDFINGLLVAAGGVAVSGLTPASAWAHSTVGLGTGDGAGGRDPRMLRGGDLPTVFHVGHWLRDARLTFGSDSVYVAPASYDDYQGTFDILPDGGAYDAIVAGSGLAGLSAAFHLRRRCPRARVLLLEARSFMGGNAARDDAPPIPVIAGTAGAYAVAPYSAFLEEFYAAIGIDWTAHVVPGPFYSYFFDDRTPFVLPGTRSWTRDVFGAGVRDLPYPTAIANDLKAARQDFRNWYNRAGAPTDPADDGDPRYDGLASITLHEYLTNVRGFHPAVSDFYTRYSVDALTGTSAQVNAYTSVSFLGSEYNPLFTFPGGTSGLARHALKWLIPGAIDGSTSDAIITNPIREAALDQAGAGVRLRQTAMVLRADTRPDGAEVIYFHDGRFWRAEARAVVLAGQAHTNHHIVAHALGAEQLAAWEQITLAPALTANVSLRRAAPLVDLELGFNQYFWGSRTWADFLVADWVTPRRFDRERPTVLTFYDGNASPPEEMPHERVRLLTTPFSEYEESLREDLHRVLAGADFDFDRDVSDVYIYRWGHALVYPKLGYVFGAPCGAEGQAQRTYAPRHIARAQLGRISFAGQDVEGSPAVESALASGHRAAEEVSGLL